MKRNIKLLAVLAAFTGLLLLADGASKEAHAGLVKLTSMQNSKVFKIQDFEAVACEEGCIPLGNYCACPTM